MKANTYKVSSKFIHELFQEKHKAISGSLCRRVEDFEKAGLISHNDAELLKGQLKNVVWESYRDLENNIRFFNEGRILKTYPIYAPKPTDNKTVE